MRRKGGKQPPAKLKEEPQNPKLKEGIGENGRRRL